MKRNNTKLKKKEKAAFDRTKDNSFSSESNDFEALVKEAFRLQLEEDEKNIPDSVLDQARIAMQEEKEKENSFIKNHPVSDSVLDCAKAAMKNRNKIPVYMMGKPVFKNLRTIMITFVALLILIPVIVLYSSNDKEKAYETNPTHQVEKYDALERQKISSIQDFALEHNLKTYCGEGLQINESYAFYKKDKIILLEEHYLFDDVECVIYVSSLNIKIDYPNFPITGVSNVYKKTNGPIVMYLIKDGIFYGQIFEYYVISFVLSTDDFEQIDYFLTHLAKQY